MQIHNNRGELIGEINVIIRPDGSTVTTNTIYIGGAQLGRAADTFQPIRRG